MIRSLVVSLITRLVECGSESIHYAKFEIQVGGIHGILVIEDIGVGGLAWASLIVVLASLHGDSQPQRARFPFNNNPTCLATTTQLWELVTVMQVFVERR